MEARTTVSGIGVLMVVGLLGASASSSQFAVRTPVAVPTIPPIVVESIDDLDAMEAVINIYLQETLNGTGNQNLALEAAAGVLGVIESHFYSGSPDVLVVEFPPLPPPMLQATSGGGGEAMMLEGEGVGELCPAPRGEFLFGDEGDWLSIEQEFSSYTPSTGESFSGGRFSLGGLGGDWTKGYTPNDRFDPGLGGIGSVSIYPDFADCLDLGGNFGVTGSNIGYGDGGPGEQRLTVGWTWSFGSRN